MYTLESANWRTVETLVGIAKEFNDQLGFTEFNEAKARAFVRDAMSPNSNSFITSLIFSGEPVGLLAGVVFEPVFSATKLAVEIGWYIQPKHRGKKAAWMIDVFEDWARSRGAKHVAMISQLGSDVDPSKFYERAGYRLTEKTYTKEL